MKVTIVGDFVLVIDVFCVLEEDIFDTGYVIPRASDVAEKEVEWVLIEFKLESLLILILLFQQFCTSEMPFHDCQLPRIIPSLVFRLLIDSSFFQKYHCLDIAIGCSIV